MTKTILLTATVFICLSLSFTSQAQWTKKKDIPPSPGRLGAICFALNNKIYVGGGYNNGTWFKDMHEYDPVSNNWTAKNDLPGPWKNRSGGVAFVINGKAYLGLGAEDYLDLTGGAGVYLSDLWEYDATADQWTKKADLPDSGRTLASVFVSNNKAYVVGGQFTTKSIKGTNDVWEYDPVTNKWTSKTPYTGYAYLYGAAAFTINGKGYITGGINLNDKGTYEYDITADVWTKKKDFPDSARLGAFSFSHNNKGFVIGGKKKSNYSTSGYFYEQQTDKWTLIPNDFIAEGRTYGVAAVVNNKAYVGGGWNIPAGNIYYNDWYELKDASLVNVQETVSVSKPIVYPNPATSIVNLKIDDSFIGSTYTLYTITGKLLLTGNIDKSKTINVTEIPAGVYILELSAAEGKAHVMVNIAN